MKFPKQGLSASGLQIQFQVIFSGIVSSNCKLSGCEQVGHYIAYLHRPPSCRSSPHSTVLHVLSSSTVPVGHFDPTGRQHERAATHSFPLREFKVSVSFPSNWHLPATFVSFFGYNIPAIVIGLFPIRSIKSDTNSTSLRCSEYQLVVQQFYSVLMLTTWSQHQSPQVQGVIQLDCALFSHHLQVVRPQVIFTSV